jgi:hypothetical protein
LLCFLTRRLGRTRNGRTSVTSGKGYSHWGHARRLRTRPTPVELRKLGRLNASGLIERGDLEALSYDASAAPLGVKSGCQSLSRHGGPSPQPHRSRSLRRSLNICGISEADTSHVSEPTPGSPSTTRAHLHTSRPNQGSGVGIDRADPCPDSKTCQQCSACQGDTWRGPQRGYRQELAHPGRCCRRASTC